MLVDLTVNLWRYSEFQNILEKLQISTQSDMDYLAENARFAAHSKCCKPSPLHSWFIYGTHDSFIHGTWLIHTCWHSITHDAGNSSVHTFMFVCGAWLVHTWDMTHWHVCPYQRGRCRQFYCPFIHIHMWDTWLIHTWDMTHSCVFTIHHANAGNSTVHSFIHVCIWGLPASHGTPILHIWDMTHPPVWTFNHAR